MTEPATSEAAAVRRPRRLRWCAAAAVTAALALIAFVCLIGAPGTLVGLLAVPALAVAAWLWRRHGAALVGPLFFYDLVRLARRGRSTLLRTLYAVFLLGALYFVYCRHFPGYPVLAQAFDEGPTLPLRLLAGLAATFASAILTLQTSAVLLLTPAYLAGAITEERERQTLPLLCTTHLTNSEIVLGKLCSRLAHLAGILLAGLPVLSLLELWGGVDVGVLLAGFAIAGFTLLSVGSVCILCSVMSRNSLTAVLTSYTIVLVLSISAVAVPCCAFVSPFGAMILLEEVSGGQLLRPPRFYHGGDVNPSILTAPPAISPPLTALGLVLLYGLVHGAIALFCLREAIRQVRSEPSQSPEPYLQALRRTGRNMLEKPFLPPPEAPVRKRYPVTDRPLLWKEVYHGVDPNAGWGFWQGYGLTLAAGLVGLLLSLLLLAWLIWGRDTPSRDGFSLAGYIRDTVNPVFRVFSALLAGAWCLGLAWRAAGCITRERAQGTLIGLLTLPAGRAVILGAKWLGSILRFRGIGGGLLALWTLALLCGALHPAALALLALAVAVHVAFLASVGVWLSLVSRNTLWAQVGMALVLLLMFVGTWVALPRSGHFSSGVPGWWDSVPEVGLNPLQTWWSLAFGWEEFRDEVWAADGVERVPLALTLAGVAGYAVAAGVFWLAAWQRFRREQAPCEK